MQCRTHHHLFYLIPVSVFQLAGAHCTRRVTSLEQSSGKGDVVVHSTSFCFPSLSCTILEQRTRYPAKCRRHKLQVKLMLLQSKHRSCKFVKKGREKHPSFSIPWQKGRDSTFCESYLCKKSTSILKVVRVVSVLRVTLFKSYLQHKSREPGRDSHDNCQHREFSHNLSSEPMVVLLIAWRRQWEAGAVS